MGRRINELLPIMIQIEENFSKLYKNMASIEGQYNQQIKTMASVLSRQEIEHANFYRSLQDKYGDNPDDMISDSAFEKASELLNSFKSSIKYESKTKIADLLEYAIDFELRNKIALEYVLEGVHGEGEAQLSFKKLIDQLIAAEEGHSNNLKNFRPKGN